MMELKNILRENSSLCLTLSPKIFGNKLADNTSMITMEE